MTDMKNILFDLDGTLTDPALGITNSVMHALKRFDIPLPPRDELYKFIGPPLAESFEKYYGFSDGQVAVEVYREYFSVKGLFENELYDGIEELLKLLYENGYRIYLATSKPEIYAKQILEHFKIDKYFTDAVGSLLNGNRVEKGEVIAYLLKKHNITDAIMIGDRCFDIAGAKENGIKSIGVLYGYGTKKELKDADFIVSSVTDLKNLLKSGL